MKKIAARIILGIIAFIVLIALLNSFFIVHEGESALVQRFGEIKAVYIRDDMPDMDQIHAQLREENYGDVRVYVGTGIKLKIPFVDNVIKYSNKLTTYDTPSRGVITSDQKVLTFDNNAQWRIENPVLFFTRVSTMANAMDRIDNIVYARMRDKVGKMDSHVLIADKEAVIEMLDELAAEVSLQTWDFGVRVVDIRIRRTDLPSDIYESIYNRMNTERERIAMQYRSEGREEAIEIRSKTDRQVVVITSTARRQAEMLMGEGDAEAARIFNEAYGRDPVFFEFYNMLMTYRETIGSSTTLVIPHSSPFARYLMGIAAPEVSAVPPPAVPVTVLEDEE